MIEDTVDHLRFIGLGSAGFCHLYRIRAVFRQSRKSWVRSYPLLIVTYEGDDGEYEFLYNTLSERDEAYVRLTKALPFLRLTNREAA